MLSELNDDLYVSIWVWTQCVKWANPCKDVKMYSIYNCNERPPSQHTRHTTIGNVLTCSIM